MVKEINDEEFESVIKEGKVLVDCYATWCGPCKMLSPIVEEVASELSEIKFFKLDVDQNQMVASNYNIMSIPTLLIFENGTLKETLVGFKTKEELKELLVK